MKNKLLLVIPTFLLVLASCAGNNPSSSASQGGDSGDSEEYSDDPSRPEGANLRIDFYLDYNHYDKDNKYYSAWWYFDRTFTKDDIGLKDPGADLTPDPYYPTFAGWSRHALVDETETKKDGTQELLYMWNFGIDKVSEEEAVGGYIELFGIYVG